MTKTHSLEDCPADRLQADGSSNPIEALPPTDSVRPLLERLDHASVELALNRRLRQLGGVPRRLFEESR